MPESRRGWSDEDIAAHIQSNGTDLDKEIYADIIASVESKREKEEEEEEKSHMIDSPEIPKGFSRREDIHKTKPSILERIVKSAKKTLLRTSLIAATALTTIPMDYAYSSEPTNVEINDVRRKSGINLPWATFEGQQNYGADVGDTPWGGAHRGYSSPLNSIRDDIQFLADNDISSCRLFLFCDARTGFDYDLDGKITNINYKASWDLSELGMITRDTYPETFHGIDVKLIPVLFDYMIADGVQYEGSTRVGEHPDFITDSDQRERLFNAMKDRLKFMASHGGVEKWDIINEPEWATAVTRAQMLDFISYFTEKLHELTPGIPVTVGTYDLGMFEDLRQLGCLDELQLHHYDDTSHWDLNTPATNFSSQTTFLGEVMPTNIETKLRNATSNGFERVLFWSLNAPYNGLDMRTLMPELVQACNNISSELHGNLRITNIKEDDNIILNVEGSLDHQTYKVMRTSNLESNIWQTAGSFFGKEGEIEVDALKQEGTAFYRIEPRNIGFARYHSPWSEPVDVTKTNQLTLRITYDIYGSKKGVTYSSTIGTDKGTNPWDGSYEQILEGDSVTATNGTGNIIISEVNKLIADDRLRMTSEVTLHSNHLYGTFQLGVRIIDTLGNTNYCSFGRIDLDEL